MGDEILLLLLTFALVLLNGFFVAAEFAIVKIRKTKVKELVASGSRRAVIARTIVGHLDAYLAACQVGITLASIALGWIGEPALARMLEPLLTKAGIMSPAAVHGIAFAVAFALISFFHIVIGEQAPKAAAIQNPERTTLLIAIPLRLFYIVLYPAIWITNECANGLLRLFGIKQASEKDLAYSPAELEMVIETSAEAGLLNEEERYLLENAINLSERRVREIMVPRPDVVYLNVNATLEQNIAIVRENRHTRYPLATEDRERVIGMIHIKDLMEAMLTVQKDFSLEKIARPVIFTPEVASLDRLLKTFQRSRTHLAIVVDEYGGVAGLCTLEDVLEELVGPIRDEFDEDEAAAPLRPAQGGEAEVDAGLLLSEVAETFKFEPIGHTNVDTIGGYVLQLLGRLPKVGDAVTIGRWRVEVREMHGLRLMKLMFRRTEDGRAAGSKSGPIQGSATAPLHAGGAARAAGPPVPKP